MLDSYRPISVRPASRVDHRKTFSLQALAAVTGSSDEALTYGRRS